MEININQLINYLQGSCNSLDQACQDLFKQDEDQLSDDQIEKIDQEIFNCSICGWWYEISEESGSDESDLICNNCAESEE